jgi:hypothetical protein
LCGDEDTDDDDDDRDDDDDDRDDDGRHGQLQWPDETTRRSCPVFVVVVFKPVELGLLTSSSSRPSLPLRLAVFLTWSSSPEGKNNAK